MHEWCHLEDRSFLTRECAHAQFTRSLDHSIDRSLAHSLAHYAVNFWQIWRVLTALSLLLQLKYRVLEFKIKLNKKVQRSLDRGKKDFEDFEMMNCTISQTIKPKSGLHKHFKYWNRERNITRRWLLFSLWKMQKSPFNKL